MSKYKGILITLLIFFEKKYYANASGRCDYEKVRPQLLCPENFVYNNATMYCDYKNQLCTTPGIVTTSVMTTPASSSPVLTTEVDCVPIPKPLCPVHNATDQALHLPDPDDCNKFYICVWGVPFSQKCPALLHFNAKLQVCDYPEYAGCRICSATSTTLVPETSSTTTTAPICHDNNSLMPDDSSCRHYFRCKNGHLIRHDCPDHLEFSSINQVCDYPEVAGCSNISVTPYPEKNHTRCEWIPNPICSDNLEGQERNNETINGFREIIRLPHVNCSKYYQCVWNIPVIQECPKGYHFDAITGYCDWPCDAKCICPNQ